MSTRYAKGTTMTVDRSDLEKTLEHLTERFATDSRDWSVDPRDAWYYGIVVGWDCETPGCDHSDDPNCDGQDGQGAMREVAARHRWTAENVATLRRHRRAVAAATSSTPADEEPTS